MVTVTLWRHRLAQWIANDDELVISQDCLDAMLDARSEAAVQYALQLMSQAEIKVPGLLFRRSKPEVMN